MTTKNRLGWAALAALIFAACIILGPIARVPRPKPNKK